MKGLLVSTLAQATFALAAFVAPLTFAGEAFAARYDIDPAHSTVTFRIKHLAISSVAGSFTEFGGYFAYDAADPKSWKTEATIQSKTIDTNQPKRDDHLRSPDFFEVAKFPTISFVSKEVTDVSGDTFKVTGDLTMHGVTKPVVLDVTKGGEAVDPNGKKRAAFHATTKLNRRDFGLTWNKVLEAGTIVVGDEVTVAIDLEGVMESA